MGAQAGSSGLGLGLGIVGGIVGSFWGMPGLGFAVGSMAGGLIGSMVFGRSGRALVPDAQLASSSWGLPLPIVYGQWRLPGMVIWEDAIEIKEHSIGKGVGGGASTSSYWQDAAFGFCEGPARLLKIWLDGKLFFDATSINPHQLTKNTFAVRIYEGDETQLPDPLIVRWVFGHVVPPLSAPAHRGTAYFVFQQIDLSHYGGRMPNVTALWSTSARDTVIFKQLAYTNSPVTGTADIGTDWISATVFTLDQDGRVSAYDVASGALLLSRPWSDIGASAVNVGPFADHAIPARMSVIQGGKLYLVSEAAYPTVYLWTLDPNTFDILQVVAVEPHHFLGARTGARSIVAFTLASPVESEDMVAIWYDLGSVAVINPVTGVTSGELPLGSDALIGGDLGIGAQVAIVVGKQDVLAGTVDLWILNAAVYAGNEFRIFKLVINNPDPAGIALALQAGPNTPYAILAGAAFGGVDPNPIWQFNIAAAYDASDDTLIIASPPMDGLAGTIKWSPAGGGTVIWRQDDRLLNTNTTGGSSQKQYWNVSFGRAGDLNGFTNYAVGRVIDGLSEDASPALGSSPNPVMLNTWAYSSAANLLIATDSAGNLWAVYLQHTQSGEYLIADIISDICTRAGFASGDFDVSAVTASTIGYCVKEQKSFGAALADVCQVYQIDMVESDDKLKFVPRGQASVRTITQADLISTQSGDASQFWVPKRAQVAELPLQINVRYIDADIDHQPNASFAKRVAQPVPTQYSNRIKSIDLPIVANAVEARHIAETWLWTLWAERTTYQSALGWKHIDLDPTDNITVSLDDGRSYTVRIETIQTGADLSLQLQLASEDITTYVASIMPGALVSAAPAVVVRSVAASLFQFNVPLLQDSDDLGGTLSRVYFASAASSAPSSAGVPTLFQSTDGAAWSDLTIAAGWADWGIVANALGATTAVFSTDTTNTLTVRMAGGSTAPASCTYAELMNGANAALVGSEVIQFQTVTENTDGSITLSDLLRGRRGTEWAVIEHSAGEKFILLAVGDISPARLPLSEIGTGESYRLLPRGWFIDQITPQAFTYLGYDLKPYAPVRLARVASGSDLALSWTRRTRLGGLMLDGTDTAPLSEASEAYEAYVLAAAPADPMAFDPTNPANYVRKFSGLSSAAATYTAAQMVTDSFTPATDTLYLVVYQISTVIGRGFPGYAALPAF
jgi:hypothetical protein